MGVVKTIIISVKKIPVFCEKCTCSSKMKAFKVIFISAALGFQVDKGQQMQS